MSSGDAYPGGDRNLTLDEVIAELKKDWRFRWMWRLSWPQRRIVSWFLRRQVRRRERRTP